MPVQLESAVVFQITRHLNDQFPRSAGGLLLGMEAEDTLEVTESFPLPVNALEGDGSNLRSKETLAYQAAVIEKLKVVGSDATIQGWYLSTNVGSLYQQSILDNMLAHQHENPASIVLVHDVALSKATSSLSLRAFRLSDEYVAARSESTGKFNSETLGKHQLSHHNILEEIPVYIHNSHLVDLFTLSKCAPKVPAGSQLSIPQQKLVESGIDSICEGIDDFILDQGNYNYYHRQLTREKQKVASWQQKRKAENAQRLQEGKPPLSLDEWKLLFQMPEEPSKFDNLLLSAQLDEYCQQVDELGAITRTVML